MGHLDVNVLPLRGGEAWHQEYENYNNPKTPEVRIHQLPLCTGEIPRWLNHSVKPVG